MKKPGLNGSWRAQGVRLSGLGMVLGCFLFCRSQLAESVCLLSNHSTAMVLANISHFVPLIPRLSGFMLYYIAINC